MTDKKLTDEEIIKALEGSILNAKWCDSKAWSIEIYKLESAFDLINRQKSEIERQNRFIESQNELISKLALAGKNATVEAYKEFAEKLENEINMRTSLSIEQDKNVIRIIHNLLKEMMGE